MEPNEGRKWFRASELLEQILDLPEEERGEAVERLGAASGVTAELRQMWAGLQRASVLDQALDEVVGALPSSGPIPHALRGRTFDGWLLGDEIGRGGMSVVYRATRAGEGFEQVAAFKILSIAFLGRDHVESFLRERKILSELRHPGIASLIDGGITPDGAPFLAMEYIEGQRIDAWCREHGETTRQIVGLMLELCRAAAHAHRHLVVHRDINPANVLVDGQGRPVLVDFGIAKLLGVAETGRTITAFTPEYAAPEQIADGTITTATDVYGLGRLLQTLLQDRRIDRELIAIMHVATHRDPEHRYATAKELAEDLQAWLDDRPVRARPDSLAYRARKFGERHWRWLGVTCLAILLAVGGAVSAAHQAKISRLAAEKHRAVAEFMLKMFQQADVMRTGADLRMTDLMATAARQAQRELADEPDTLVSLLSLIASGQLELTNYDAAADALNAAESVIAHNDISPASRAEYLEQRGKQAHEQGDFAGAVGWVERAVALLQAEPRDSKPYQLVAATLVAYQVDAEQYDQALALAKRLYAQVDDGNANPEAKARVTHEYAVALEVSGKLDEAFKQYRHALELQRAYQPENALGRAEVLSDYGIALYFADRFKEAERINREVLEIYQQQFQPPHPRISSALHNVAFALVGQGRLDEAVGMLERAYQMTVQLHGPDHIDTLLEQATLGTLIAKNGDLARAEAILRENLASLERVAPDLRMQRGSVHSYLGDVLLQAGRLEESRSQYQQALELFSDLPDDNVRVVEARARLAEIAGKLGDGA